MQEQIMAVQRMQDYIEEHYNETITLVNLSNVSFFSPWYSYRLFKEYTNYTPADYIRKLRLSRSAMRLRDEECKIVDIAFELGFQSLEGYQRAFLKEFGCNPSEYAKNPIPIYLFISYGVIYNEIRKERRNIPEVKNIFVTLIKKPERKVLIKRGKKATDYFEYYEEDGMDCDIWGLLTSIKSISGEPVSMWLPDEYILPGTSKYVQGVEVEVDYNGIIPEGFDTIILPEAEYLMFQGEPFLEIDYCQAICGIQQAIDKYDFNSAGYEVDLKNPRIQLEPIAKRGYIEMVAVKKLV